MAEGNNNGRVLVIEHDQDIADMEVSALETEGYDARRLLATPGIVEEVAREHPALVILDLHPMEADPYRILDDLRANPATQAVPVLAVSTIEPVAQSAMASYNVRVTLEKPFGLEEFRQKVQEALGQTPLHAEVSQPLAAATGDLVDQAAQIVARHSRDALFRWVQRLRQEPPWENRQDLALSDLFDSVPLLVEALSVALQYRNAEQLFSRLPDSTQPVQEHAALRKRQGFSLEELMHEYSLLRDELLSMLECHLPEEASTGELFTVVRLLNETVDQITEITALAYARTANPTTPPPA